MRKHQSFTIKSVLKFKNALLEWSKPNGKIVWLDSNEHADSYGSFDAILAITGQTDKSSVIARNIDELKYFIDKKQDWFFGYLTYDLKNRLEHLVSNNYDGLDFPEIHFFQPDKIITIKEQKVNFLYRECFTDEIQKDFLQISQIAHSEEEKPKLDQSVRIKLRIHKDAYFEKANRFLEHIHRGDIYEANFCQEFYAENTEINPWETYKNLNVISKPPFASFLRLDDRYLLCASPERYLKKEGQNIISQPIKGTAPRGANTLEDKAIKARLENDEKERAENIMITDLVRNDLSKSAIKGSVEVDELCAVYTFEQVHQLISTVRAKVSKDKNPVEIIKETFPMGSMTGAPKISAMKIIEDWKKPKEGCIAEQLVILTHLGILTLMW